MTGNQLQPSSPPDDRSVHQTLGWRLFVAVSGMVSVGTTTTLAFALTATPNLPPPSERASHPAPLRFALPTLHTSADAASIAAHTFPPLSRFSSLAVSGLHSAQLPSISPHSVALPQIPTPTTISTVLVAEDRPSVLLPSVMQPRFLTVDYAHSSLLTNGGVTPVSGIFSCLHPAAGCYASSLADQHRAEMIPTATASSTATLKLTLADVVVLVLQNNRTVKNAYLQRILDRQDLELAESVFTPRFTPEIRISYDRSYVDTTTESGMANASVGASLLLPTGARISVNLVGESFGGSLTNNALRQGFSATVTQPLLQGYGVDVNTASVQTARLQEQANLLSLKNTLMSVITNAIQSYRSLLLAQEQLKIQERSLTLAKRQLEDTIIFVELGQRPRSDIVQAQTGVAQREVSLASARNSLGQAQLVLLQVLNLEQTLLPEAVEVPQVQQAAPLEIAPFIQTALANNPAYLQTRLAIDQGKLRLLLAQNRSQWNLDLQASVGNTLRTDVTGQVNLGAAIVLSRTFGDVSLEQGVERSQVQLQQLENTLLEAAETLTVNVRNTVRSVNDSYQQLVLAQQARELAAQQLDNEREKYRLGFGDTRQIDVLRFEDDLAAAQTAELAAAIAYLNALTQLEQLVGTTLDRWNITLEATVEDK